MASSTSVKKRRIMIITDESLIEQIEKGSDSSAFQSIVIESENDQISLSSALVSV